MAERHISQAPIQPGATTEADLYTVPSGFEAIISTLMICNNHATASDTFRVRKALNGAATNVNQSWFNEVPIGPGESMKLDAGMTLGDTDVIRVRSVGGNVVFDIGGVEVS